MMRVSLPLARLCGEWEHRDSRAIFTVSIDADGGPLVTARDKLGIEQYEISHVEWDKQWLVFECHARVSQWRSRHRLRPSRGGVIHELTYIERWTRATAAHGYTFS